MPETVPTMSFDRRKAAHAHPSLVQSLINNKFYNLTCTIQLKDLTIPGNRTPSGDIARPGVWTDVLVDIPCRKSAPQSAERQSNERPMSWGRLDENSYVVALDGLYPQVTAAMRGVVSDGTIIDIRGVASDSELRMTTFTGRTVVPGSEGFE